MTSLSLLAGRTEHETHCTQVIISQNIVFLSLKIDLDATICSILSGSSLFAKVPVYGFLSTKYNHMDNLSNWIWFLVLITCAKTLNK